MRSAFALAVLVASLLAASSVLGAPRTDLDPRLAPSCRGWRARAVYQAADRAATMASLVSADGRVRHVHEGDAFDGFLVAGIAYNFRRVTPAVWLWDGASLCQAGFEPQPAVAPAVSPSRRSGAAGAAAVRGEPKQGSSRAHDFGITMDRAELGHVMSELPALTKGVRALPAWKDGRIESVRLLGIRSGSFLGRIGLRSGDRVLRVDGEPIGSMERLMGLYARLGSQDDWTVTLERGGAVIDVTVALR